MNYAQQNEDVDMIPLMMEKNYKPKVRRKLSSAETAAVSDLFLPHRS